MRSRDFDGFNFQFSINKNDLKRKNETSDLLKNFIVGLKDELYRKTQALKLPVFQLSITLYFNCLNEFKILYAFNDFLKYFYSKLICIKFNFFLFTGYSI